MCFFSLFFFERTRAAASMRPPCLIFRSTSIDWESCTRPISTKSGSMEVREYELTCGACFVASRLETVGVARLLWISWYVLGAAVFRVFFSFVFLRTHTVCCKHDAALPHSPLY